MQLSTDDLEIKLDNHVCFPSPACYFSIVSFGGLIPAFKAPPQRGVMGASRFRIRREPRALGLMPSLGPLHHIIGAAAVASCELSSYLQMRDAR